MKLTSRWIAIWAFTAAIFAMSAVARAQSASDATSAPPHAGPVFFEHLGPGPDVFFGPVDFMGFEGPAGHKTVTGAPFTAAFSSQSSQTLLDGNVIQHNSTGSIARDSQGRMRRDVTLPAIGSFAASGQNPPHVVMINDPVAGAHYILHPDQRTAESVGAHGTGHYAKRARIGDDGNALAGTEKRAAEVATTSLGIQMINGVSAEGTRYTRTIPAGEIGNERPIQIVVERWYSSELQMNVMTKRTDPIHGNSVFQLTEIQRSEPAADLFQVPADYTVTQAGLGRMRVPPPPAE